MESILKTLSDHLTIAPLSSRLHLQRYAFDRFTAAAGISIANATEDYQALLFKLDTLASCFFPKAA